MISISRRAALAAFSVAATLAAAGGLAAAEPAKTVTLDYAYYNPVSLVLKDKGWVEQEFAKDGIAVRWVLSLGSNKAIEFLNARSIDFGSTAGSAALLAKINGSPIKAIYIYSKPEWTALVTKGDSPIRKVEDLKGKRVAVTRGTDPYIFLLRTLAQHGLTERDIRPVLLQHQDGRTALEQGQVDAWAGLDPMMAQTEVEQGSRLFFRNADLNTYGFLNVREAFATENPEITRRLLATYEKGRRWAVANPDELKRIIATAAKLTDPVAAKQLERTDLSNPAIGEVHREAILAAGLALQESGVVPENVAVKEVVDALIEPRFSKSLAQVQ
jgi:sulfonate transport system substrate-binding protein